MPTSRRRFAQLLAAVAASTPFAPHLVAQTPPPVQSAPQPPPPPAEKVPSAFAKAQTAIVAAEFGAFLNAEEMGRIEKDFTDGEAGLRRLRAFRLTNADEPDTTFASLRGRHGD